MECRERIGLGEVGREERFVLDDGCTALQRLLYLFHPPVSGERCPAVACEERMLAVGVELTED